MTMTKYDVGGEAWFEHMGSPHSGTIHRIEVRQHAMFPSPPGIQYFIEGLALDEAELATTRMEIAMRLIVKENERHEREIARLMRE